MKPKIPPTGELRRSQILTTFGPGAMVDLPEHAVIVAGLNYWHGEKDRIYEDRLEAWLRKRLQVPSLTLFAPPIPSGEVTAARSGIDVFRFPAWFLGQIEEKWRSPDGREYRTRPLIPFERLVKGGYLDVDKKVRPVVPVRFVQACERGHISDIDWFGYVRRDYSTARTGELWFDEGGAGNDFAEMWVRDVSRNNLRRPLSEAAIPKSPMLGKCSGRSPWLGPRVREACDRDNRLLTRAASNTYFSQTVTVISLPDGDQLIKSAVDRVYEDFLKECTSEGDVRYERKKAKVAAALDGLSDAVVWADLQRRQGNAPPVDKSLKQTELETLLAQKDTLGEDLPDGDFYARTHPIGELPACAAGTVDRLVLVHRLREVCAQVGFTRFDPSLPDINGELDLDIVSAPLARDLTWVPASENRGEGVFLSFSAAAIDHWQSRPEVIARRQQLQAAFDTWRARKNRPAAIFPGLPYIMLHSLSHALITALSLDCGYSASAIRERIYAGDFGYGILLYTGTPGSEGSLGGLVEMGKDLGRHLGRALELSRLCSNDPVCAQHDATSAHEARFLHGAACHGCLLIAETSCERRNELLDRALVVPTVATPGAAFFMGPS